MWSQNVFENIGRPIKRLVVLSFDNQSCIHMKYVRIEEQYADILTKSLAKPCLEELRNELGMMAIEEFETLDSLKK